MSEAAAINWESVYEYVKNRGDINHIMEKTGYTVLHLAVLFGSVENVMESINLGANVNFVGRDGAQPLHIACLEINEEFVEVLLKNGADPNVEFTREIYEKYCRIFDWPDDFGGTITLLTFVVKADEDELANLLLEHKANFRITDIKNKTLLMYAFEESSFKTASVLLKYMKGNLELINSRDNDGLHAVHYLLSNKRFGDYRFDVSIRNIFSMTGKSIIITDLINAGADINAMVNDDPDTLLINMAAYRCCNVLLDTLLNLDVPFNIKAKPLHYYMLPVDPTKSYLDNAYTISHPTEMIEERRNKCLTIILEYLVLRRKLGLFVCEEEIEFMDKLIATDPKIKKIVSDYENNNKMVLRNKEISYGGNKTISVFDLMVKVFNHKNLKLLVQDEQLVEAYKRFYGNKRHDDRHNLYKVMNQKITRADERRKLMTKVKETRNLKNCIPLPYEIILIIIEFVDNDNLKKFVDSFYQNYIC